MSYSCPPASLPQTPYPATASAAQQQQHPGYAQPSQPMVSAVDALCQSAPGSIGVLKITDHFEVSAACVLNEHDVCGVCEDAGRLFDWILDCSFDVFLSRDAVSDLLGGGQWTLFFLM